MMDHHVEVLLLLTVIHIVGDVSGAHMPARPIYEATEEVMPLIGNPLGGGSPEIVKRNTMMHVRNQRKIYDIELIERRKAQHLQKAILEPQDSYLRAYHEQHEQFHMDLEQKMMQQMKPPTTTVIPQTKINNANDLQKQARISNLNQINEKQDPKVESSLTVDSIRNKRLDTEHFGNNRPTPRSVEYAPGFFLPMRQQFIPKVGNREKFKIEDVSALTSAALRGSNPYSQYSQLNGYKKYNGDVQSSLTALIGKEPEDQLKGLSYLLQQSSSNHKITGLDLKNSHINLKASALDVPEEYYKSSDYGSNPISLNSYQKYVYAQTDEHAPRKDHIPITEAVDEVDDLKRPSIRYTALPTAFTYVPDAPTVSTPSSDFYNVQPEESEEYQSRDIVYKTTPSYSYTSGHDNVSIEVKDKFNGDEEGLINIKKGYNKTIPFGAKLRPKNVKSGGRSKRESDKMDYVVLYKSTNKKQFPQNTQRPSDSQQSNFTQSHSTKLKSSIVNTFSPPTNESTNQFSNHILRNLSSHINCSECFKPNGDSEFYYYEDSSENGTEAYNNDDFPSYDDDLQEVGNTNKSKLTLKSLSAGEGRSMPQPHSTKALPLRFIKRPKLYRLLNGIKTRVMSPNPSRYRKYLVRKPVRLYYSRYANDFNDLDPRLKDSYDYAASNNYNDQADYGDDYSDDYYEDEEVIMYDDLASYKYGRRPRDPYEDYASQSQYAAGFNYQDDFISIDALQRNNRNNRFNKHGYRNGKGKHRYASNYEDYINEDLFNEYTRNVRNRYYNNRGLSSFDDYDYSQNPYSDGYDYLDGGYNIDNFPNPKYSGQESQFSSYYSDKGYTDSYGNYFSGDKRKKLDPSNYYVENFNQYVSKPNQHSNREPGHQKPISVFNIFRNENPSKGHELNKHKLIDDGDVIHIDNLNVFQNGHKVGWKGPKKPLHHLPYRPHYRPVKHRRRKPLKWRKPRPIFHRRSSPKKKYHMVANLNKINRIIRHK